MCSKQVPNLLGFLQSLLNESPFIRAISLTSSRVIPIQLGYHIGFHAFVGGCWGSQEPQPQLRMAENPSWALSGYPTSATSNHVGRYAHKKLMMVIHSSEVLMTGASIC